MRRLWVFPAARDYFRDGSVGRRAGKGALLLYLGFGIYFVGVRL